MTALRALSINGAADFLAARAAPHCGEEHSSGARKTGAFAAAQARPS